MIFFADIFLFVGHSKESKGKKGMKSYAQGSQSFLRSWSKMVNKMQNLPDLHSLPWVFFLQKLNFILAFTPFDIQFHSDPFHEPQVRIVFGIWCTIAFVSNSHIQNHSMYFHEWCLCVVLYIVSRFRFFFLLFVCHSQSRLVVRSKC